MRLPRVRFIIRCLITGVVSFVVLLTSATTHRMTRGNKHRAIPDALPVPGGADDALARGPHTGPAGADAGLIPGAQPCWSERSLIADVWSFPAMA